jgi:hypothetical protein
MKQCDLTKGFVVFLTIMITLFCGVMPSSWAEDCVVSECDYCDSQNFEGCYGFSHSGIMLMQNVDINGPVFDNKGNPVITETPMASGGLLCLTDDGKLTGHEMVQFGTDSFHAMISGSYTVCPDCTGTATICAIPDGSPSGIESTIFFVITSEGKEIQMVTTDMVPCVSVPTSVSAASSVPIIEPINIVGIAKKQSK